MNTNQKKPIKSRTDKEFEVFIIAFLLSGMTGIALLINKSIILGIIAFFVCAYFFAIAISNRLKKSTQNQTKNSIIQNSPTQSSWTNNMTNKHSNKRLYESNYNTALTIINFIEAICYILILIAVVMIASGFKDSNTIIIYTGIGLIAMGLLYIMGAQVTKATLDNADHTREILKILKNGDNN